MSATSVPSWQVLTLTSHRQDRLVLEGRLISKSKRIENRTALAVRYYSQTSAQLSFVSNFLKLRYAIYITAIFLGQGMAAPSYHFIRYSWY